MHDAYCAHSSFLSSSYHCKAASCAICRCIRSPWSVSMRTWKHRVTTRKMLQHRCSCRCEGGKLEPECQPRGFTAWWAFTPGLPASRSPAWVCMGYGRLLRPMPWSMKPISPRFSSGWDTQTSARHAYTIGGPQDLRTHQIIKSGIKQNALKAPSRGAFFVQQKNIFKRLF